ncbi:ectoine/hydroxyectoine ABC transporter substrate-binding protein EhuB [Mycolicibacterium agri]|uniref:Ectoine/hydroxyectoine ABC transporter substrate-binding protein EhuB n=2 Tax=Mycolicibacterium agri TaxID=36811 RepID=A0A7I9W7B5_MYCAG|nr:ectoine/hydroxyectoine ABC transporter substrate-binding protein EhuB [Mycolicibacterium agri]GFG53581.1 ectoine/hydroxyectoine ABC transporter substrate-binding protein EhuB [Mycolicibacterium agri]
MPHDPSRRQLLRGIGAMAVGIPLADWLSGCTFTEPGTGAPKGSVLDRGRRQGYLRVAVFNEPPYTKLEVDGTVTGAEPDVLRAVLQQLGIGDIRGARIEYDAMIPALKSGQVDVIAAGLFMKQSRCAEVAYTEPVIVSTESFAVPPGNPQNITTIQVVLDNPALKIAVLPGGFEEGILIAANVPQSQRVIVRDNVSGVEALAAGRVNAFLLPTLSLRGMAEVNKSFEVTDPIEDAPATGSGAAFEKSQTDDVAKYNQVLAEFKEGQEFADIMQKWGFDADAALGVTAEELCKAEG